MNRSIRCFFSIVTSILILTFSSSTLTAAEKAYPNKPLTIIIPWAVGGGTDMATRALAKEMQQSLGQPVIVESRTGNSGLLAGEFVTKAAPDGYTLGTFTSDIFVPEVYVRLRRAPFMSQDLEPVIRWMNLPYGLLSRTDVPWSNLKEFIKYVQANPNKVRLGHSAFGDNYHLLYFGLARMNNLEMIEVPYKGAGETKVALLGGHIDVVMASMAAFIPFMQTGKVRLLAYHNSKKMPEFGDTPRFEDAGVLPGFPYAAYGIFAPKGTPQDIKNKIHDAVKKALETPSLEAFAKANSIQLYYGSTDDLKEDMKKDKTVVTPVLEDFVKKYK
jgi:tripartite-type tricarboxylate transporter receptor subunit TctC